MRFAFTIAILALLGAVVPFAGAAEVRLRWQGTNALLSVEGDPDNDWRIQTSSDLTNWSTVTTLAPLLAAGSNGPTRALGGSLAPQNFYRAIRTAGLFDPSLLRTISLTFTQSNWQSLLAIGRTTGLNVLGRLAMDNGATNVGVGARYKGNSSFGLGGLKKSINLEFDYTNAMADLMGYETINLNNAAGDETIMREPLYFNILQNYAPGPKGSMAKLYINGAYWGVYSFVQQENGQLINEWFSSNNGDRWRTPNAGGNAALNYLGTNAATYQSYYEIRTTNSVNPWTNLIHAIDVLNNTPSNLLRDKVEEVLAVDRWLWFLAVENIFADDDSYFHKGADYGFYYEPESGRIHPIEHDGNEAFNPLDVSLSPVQGFGDVNRPVLNRLLGVPELRQRYLAHLRTVLQEFYQPAVLTPLINHYHSLSVNEIVTDPVKYFTMTEYTNELVNLKTFVTNRYAFLTNHAELRPVSPVIVSVSSPSPPPTATQTGLVTAVVQPSGTNGLHSVWLYHRGHSYGRFTTVQMFDDGTHGDGVMSDGIFGAATTNYPAGTRVRYYVEARSANGARAARFSPERAEQETHSYRVALTTASHTAVVLNELMASNTNTLADPQGEFDDWIELRNLTDQPVDLSGHYLSDEPTNPRKWQFPAGTTIPADGFLLVWADEDGIAPGLHASFKLATSGEQLFFTDTDANLNAVLDSVTFGSQQTDRSYGRSTVNADAFLIMDPTPGLPNR